MASSVEDFTGVASIQALENLVRQFQSVISPPHGSGQVLVVRFEQSPPTFVHFLGPAHVRPKEHTTLIPEQELARGPGLPAQLVVPCGNIEIEIRELVQCRGQRGRIVALIAQVAEDKPRSWMTRQHAIAGGEQLLVSRNVLASQVEALEIRRALLVGPQRLPAGRVVGNVHVDGQAELRAFFPECVQARVIEPQAAHARRINTGALESPALVGDLSYAPRPAAVASLQFTHRTVRVILRINACDIDPTIDLEPVRVGLKKQVSLPIEAGARCLGKDNRQLNADLVHPAHPRLHAADRLHLVHG